MSDKPARTSRAVYWRCFHCGDTFTKAQAKHAEHHFGRDCGETPVCLIREPGEYYVLRALRDAQDDLAAYRAEDTELHRALHAMSAEHGEKVRRAEEVGYERALRDIEAGKVEAAHAQRILAALEPMKDAA